MKKFLTCLLSANLFISYGFCGNEFKSNQNPTFALNSQDVPIFYDNNPLTELKAFTVITSFPLKNLDIQKKLEQLIESTLNQVGEVIHLEDNDMRGFGTGNVLLIQIGNIIAWDGNTLPVSRLSLSIETPVTSDKTGIKTFPMVWSINAFLKENVDSASEINLTKAMQKLLSDFVQSYQYANRDQIRKVVFYTYD